MPSTPFDNFVERVLLNPALKSELLSLQDAEVFQRRIVLLGAENGYAFDIEEVKNAIRARRRAWIERFCSFGRAAESQSDSNAAFTNLNEDLDGFIPIGVYWKEGQPLVEWCYKGNTRFTESFFEQTITQMFRLPFNQLFRPVTKMDVLVKRAKARPGVPPTGFIFHMSRCGSTLVSQMLAALPGNIVVSEASAIDSVLRADLRTNGLKEEEQVEWFRAMVSAMAQPNPGQSQFFIKFDCINVLHLPLIRRAFPEVPWIFLYRNPVEVMVSQTRQRGGLLVPGAVEPQLMGWNPCQINGPSLNEYGAAVLGKVCEAAIRFFDPVKGRLINYTQLPEALTKEISAHFGLRFSAEELATIKASSQVHAKHPHFTFTADSEGKRKEASQELVQVVDYFLSAPYEKLEKLRTSVTVLK